MAGPGGEVAALDSILGPDQLSAQVGPVPEARPPSSPAVGRPEPSFCSWCRRRADRLSSPNTKCSFCVRGLALLGRRGARDVSKAPQVMAGLAQASLRWRWATR